MSDSKQCSSTTVSATSTSTSASAATATSTCADSSSASSSSSCSSSTTKIRSKNWLPLESNPSLMNKYIHSLGISGEWAFVDVLGVDEALLSMIPPNVGALLLLFPITTNSENYRQKLEKEISEEKRPSAGELSSVYFLEQKIGNACGTIGLIHALLNNRQIPRDSSKFFGTFYEKTKNLNPADRAHALEDAVEIELEHEAIAAEAKSNVEHAVNDNLHFIALVNVNGILYELDGMKSSPIAHGNTSKDSFLKDAIEVVKQFMERDPTDLRFNITALVEGGEAFD